MLIYIAEPNEIHPEAISLLKSKGFGLSSSLRKENIEAVFIRTYTQADKKFLDQFPKLKYLLRAGVGLDNIDLLECKKRNIKVINAPGSNANAVAEYVIASVIMLIRHANFQVKSLKAGGWRKKEWMGEEIKGKTIGLVGCGAIGKLIVKKLANWEINKVLGYDPYLDNETLKKAGIEKVELDYLLQNSDIVSLHLPLTPDTKNLIDQNRLKLMKKTSYLINTSRGGIVNEADLVKALKNRKIAGAVLDVFENEPNVRKELLDLPNVIASPHIAGFTVEADREMSMMPAHRLLYNS